MKKAVVIVVILVAVIGLGIYLSTQDSKPTVTNDFSAAPTGTQLLANMQKAGLSPLSAEGTVLHIHQHLDLIVNGQSIDLPNDIGIGLGYISPIHTHTPSANILHVESPVQKDYTLGQFFDEWGVTLSDTCLGTDCADSQHKLLMAVNGTPVDKDFRNYVLKPHDEIELWYGSTSEHPDFIKSFNFPQGL